MGLGFIASGIASGFTSYVSGYFIHNKIANSSLAYKPAIMAVASNALFGLTDLAVKKEGYEILIPTGVFLGQVCTVLSAASDAGIKSVKKYQVLRNVDKDWIKLKSTFAVMLVAAPSLVAQATLPVAIASSAIVPMIGLTAAIGVSYSVARMVTQEMVQDLVVAD